MTISIVCKRCKEPILAEDEDDLMRQVEEHARDHGGAHGKHVPPRDKILGHLRQRKNETDS